MGQDLIAKFEKRFGAEEAARLNEALDFASLVHDGQLRDTGEPYIIHPLAVAEYLLDMGMDVSTIIAGLLHDVVEDGENISVAEVEKRFGKDVAGLVDSVTKLTKSGKQTYITKKQEQSENLRKLFLAIAADVRVVIIKLADRLHNMRTLEQCLPQKQQRKSKETLEVYAPLAHRFGMGAIRSELEDLSFRYLMPQEYKHTLELVSEQKQEREEVLNSAMREMQLLIKEAGIEAQISGRPKHLYSTYRKMQRLSCPITDIYDLIAIRVIVSTVNDCYAALGVIHSAYRPLPGRFKDYIAMPKPNMYRSLHTTLMSENGISFEVQIRTFEMHQTAEYGIAAHWMYKEGRANPTILDRKTHWLRQVLEAKETTEDSGEFVENILKDFLGEYVFVLSPKGEIFDLPIGSTPLDFAYRIHTNIGHKCQHARVNGNMVRLDYKLKTNDVVEIITSNSQVGPSRDWLNIVKTQSAKNKIRQWFKRANRDENIQKGREMLEEAARRHGRQLSALMKPEYIQAVLQKHSLATQDDMYSAIGFGGISSGQVLHKLIELQRKDEKLEAMHAKLSYSSDPAKPVTTKQKVYPNGIIVKGDTGMAVRFGSCCNPIPGDAIIGYITRGRGVSVHRADCKNIGSLIKDAERIIEVEWATDLKSVFTASVVMHLIDKSGSLLEVSKVLTSLNVNISAMSSRSTDQGYAMVSLSFVVTGSDQLQVVMNALRRLKSVLEIYRVEG